MRSETSKIGGFLFAGSLLLFGLGDGQIAALSLAAEAQELQTVTLRIEGMSCGACVKEVRSALAKVPGVKDVDVKVGTKWLFFNDYTDARAMITFESEQGSVEALIKAVEGAGGPMFAYKARPIQ